MLLILFGLSGSGKNFVGEIIAKQFDYYHWDADLALTSAMKEQIPKQELFTQKMRDDFTQLLMAKIIILRQQHKNIVISQALYKEKNRQQIALTYPEAKFIYITATQENIIARLKQRKNFVDEAYAEIMSHEFEVPEKADAIILNNTDTAAIVCQLKHIV